MLPALIALASAIAPPHDWVRTHERAEIRRVVNANRTEIFRCNELAPMADSLCSGWVNVRFWINADGRVSHAELARNTLTNTAIPACMLRAVKSWRFRRVGTGPLEVVYPFHFHCAG